MEDNLSLEFEDPDLDLQEPDLDLPEIDIEALIAELDLWRAQNPIIFNEQEN